MKAWLNATCRDTKALATVGASLTATPLKLLLPVTGAATPSDTLVATVKLPLKLSAGVKVSAANRVLRLVMAPLAVHTPVAAL